MQRFPWGLGDTAEARSPGEERRALLAAMYGVYAAAELRDEGGSPLTRPLSMAESLAIIKEGKGKLRDRAFRVAGAKLSVGAMQRDRPDMRMGLVDLCGREMAEKILHLRGPHTPSRMMAHAYRVFAEGGLGDGAGPAVATPMPTDDGTHSGLDIRTLLTSVNVHTAYQGSFADLAELLDPQGWSSSPFWLAATKVLLVDGRFVPDPHPPALGTSWSGYFYEDVQWALNRTVLAQFQTYLKITYRVEAPRIDLSFSLYSARGSMVLARVADTGVDVDSGGAHATLFVGGLETYDVTALKRVRFSDFCSRSTPNQGGEGAGQMLNYQAPAIVALWMNDLFYESLHQGARG
jgi:hypothetical protein